MTQFITRHKRRLRNQRASYQPSRLPLYRWVTIAYLCSTALIGSALIALPAQPSFTVGGVPTGIIWQFLQDEEALSAYFSGDRQRLHDRLDEMGVEEAMKDFYRPHVPNEAALDQHIHQIFYDRTGYVGAAYRVTAGGRLVPKR